MDLSNEFNDEVNSLFTRLSDVPYRTNEWVGTKASYYFRTVSNDKFKYIEFANSLRNLSNMISKSSYEIQNCINKCHNEEL